jgi:hypothetical protein
MNNEKKVYVINCNLDHNKKKYEKGSEMENCELAQKLLKLGHVDLKVPAKKVTK